MLLRGLHSYVTISLTTRRLLPSNRVRDRNDTPYSWNLSFLSKLKYIYLLFCVLILLEGCATTEPQIKESKNFQNESEMVWPPPPYPAKIRFIRSISSFFDFGAKKNWLEKVIDSLAGKEETENLMLRPHGIYVQEDKIYVTDPGLFLVHVFDQRKKKYFKITEAKNQHLISPIGIAVDTTGKIYVSDSYLRKIFIFNTEGNYLGEIGSNNLFKRPTGLAIYKNRIYVVDTLESQIKVFSKDSGKLLFSFGENGTEFGKFHFPTHIFIDDVEDYIYITDSLNFRIQIFDIAGNFISSFGQLGDALGNFSKPKGIAVDSDGHIYVTDSDFDVVQIFDRNGTLLLVFGGTGVKEGHFLVPGGIFIDKKDYIYVADSYNRRIQIFKYIKT